jgi:DNA-binding beta-propeller fold protein YncE
MRGSRIALTAAAMAIAAGLAAYGISELTSPSRGPTTGPLRLLATIALPGRPLAQFDISWVDPSSGRYYLSDVSNAGVDVIDTRTDRFVERIGGFVGGAAKTHDEGGPNGVVAILELHELWVGDGDSQVRVVDTATDPARIVDTVQTGGKMRTDELAYDPDDGLILAANDADDAAFVSIISTRTHRLLGRLAVPEAAHGLEQSVWDGPTRSFYLAVPAVSGVGVQLQSLAAGKGLKGEILRIDPRARAITGRIATQGCINTGLAHGPGSWLLLGCFQSDVTQALDLGSGRIVRIDAVGGADEVAYDPGRRRYYVAAAHNDAGPVLGVIDADTDRWLQNVQTASEAHSVAADPASGHILVALPPNTLAFDNNQTRGFDCRRGCVGVYGEK